MTIKTSRRNLIKTTAGAAGAIGLASTLNFAPKAHASGHKKYVIYLNTHGSVDVSFWSACNNGFQAFCKAHNIDGRYVGTIQDGDVAEERANLERIIAAGDADAICQVFTDPEVLEEPSLKAIKRGIPIVAINSKDNRDPRRIPYLRYVGEDTYQVGRRNATEALNSFKKITGRAPNKSAYLEHVPGIWVLVERGRGMANVLEPEGTKFETVAVTPDPVQTSELVRAYLLQNPDVETFHTGWSRPAVWAIKVLQEMGRLGNVNKPWKKGNVYVTGIDVDEEFLQFIENGDAVGTIDQQVYLQGWYGAAIAYQWITHQFLIDSDIGTGPYFVDGKIAGKFKEQAAKGLRA